MQLKICIKRSLAHIFVLLHQKNGVISNNGVQKKRTHQRRICFAAPVRYKNDGFFHLQIPVAGAIANLQR